MLYWLLSLEGEEGLNKDFSVYIVECSDGSLYTGISTEVERRILEHNTSKKGSKYTRSRRPVKLVFQRKIGTRSEAMKEERRIKKLTRYQKLNLIANPEI